MPHEFEFVQAMREEPQSLAPLLIYADWLEERGQTNRAELIRAQLERQSDRDRALRRQNEVLWRLEELPKIPGLHWGHFERGMVWSVVVDDLKVFAQHADTIVRSEPIIKVFDRGHRRSNYAGVFESPAWEWIREFRIQGNLKHSDIQLLAQSPRLLRLEKLEIHSANLEQEGLLVLSDHGFLANVKVLNLGKNRLSNSAVLAWIESLNQVHALESLNLLGNRVQSYLYATPDPLHESTIENILESPWLPSLRQLYLDWNNISADFRAKAIELLNRRKRSQPNASFAGE